MCLCTQYGTRKNNSSYKEIKETAIQYEEQQKYSVQSLIYVITGQVLHLRKARLLGTMGEGRPPRKATLNLS